MKKKEILVLGGGKIGSLISCLLAESGDYSVRLLDSNQDAAQTVDGIKNIAFTLLDVSNQSDLCSFIDKFPFQAIVSALPYFHGPLIARVAREKNLHYFDLTEDVMVAKKIKKISENAEKAFVPQCGLAPGFISIVTQDLIKRFETVDSVKMRVGALPMHPNNALKYSLTWSTDGLINEYGNLCEAIVNEEMTSVEPLGGLETIEVDGLLYEAFNTSGGLGTLAESCLGKVMSMNYKTMRYPGHCEKIKLLMKDLKLNKDRDTLKRILENAIPKTKQDVVLIYSSVTGVMNGEYYEENYFKKIYSVLINEVPWSAIQITTASSLCTVLDLVVTKPNLFSGFIRQEDFALQDFLNNRFGLYYNEKE